jgi:YVTN family beta-propeller protein
VEKIGMPHNVVEKRPPLGRIAVVLLVGVLMAITLPGVVGSTGPSPTGSSGVRMATLPSSTFSASPPPPQPLLNESTLVLFNNTLVPSYYVSVSSSLPSLEVFDPQNNEVFVEGFYAGVIDALSAKTNEVVATISTGAYPNTLAYDAPTNSLFFGLQTYDEVSDVNASTDLIERTVGIGFEPLAMAVDPVSGNLFVTGWNSTGTAYVAVLSGTTGVVDATFPFGASRFPIAGPNGLAYDPANGEFYIASIVGGAPGTDGNLTVLNATTFANVTNVTLPFNPDAILYAPSNGNLYLGNQSGDDLSVFHPASAKIIGTVKLPNVPSLLTYGSTHKRIYVGIDGNVSVVSTSTNKVTTTFPVTRQPDGHAFDPTNGDLYISDYVWNNVSVVNTTSFQVAGSILLGALPYNMAFDSANGDLYVADLESDQLIVVNASSNHVIRFIPLGATPYGIVYDPVTKDLYVDNFYAGNVSVVSGASNALIGYLPAGVNPWGIAYDGANHDLYVTNVGSNNITVLNPHKGTVVKNLNFTTPPGAIAYDPKSETLFVGEYNVGNVSVLNATTNRLIANVSTGSEPYTISVDPGTGDAFVGNYASDNVTVLGPRGQEQGLNVAAGVGVFGSTYSPVDGDIYVASFYSDLLTVINSTSATGVGGYPVRTGPVAVAADPVTGTIYVANYDSGSLTVLTHPAILPVYNVTFVESGLVHGKRWSVALGGVLKSTTSASITFSDATGNYTYLVAGPSGFDVSGLAPEGTIRVAGTNLTQTVAFVRGTTYTITFHEAKLPAGTLWCVIVGSQVCSTTPDLAFKNLTDGGYTFTVVPVSGYTPTPSSGTITLAGATLREKIIF